MPEIIETATLKKKKNDSANIWTFTLCKFSLGALGGI